jgi:hypothetical protein
MGYLGCDRDGEAEVVIRGNEIVRRCPHRLFELEPGIVRIVQLFGHYNHSSLSSFITGQPTALLEQGLSMIASEQAAKIRADAERARRRNAR